MSGYAKRMMRIADAWLRANPDPRSATLQLPRRLDQLVDLRKDIADVNARIARARREGREDLALKYTEVRDKFQKIQTDPELASHLDELSTMVNTPYRLSQNKIARTVSVDGEDDALWYAVEAPWLLAWARDGYNVFDLSPDFVAAMLLTDPTEIDLPSLKLPFRGMLFMIPDRFAIGAEGTSYTKIHVVETDDSRIFDVDVPRDPNEEKRPAIAIYATDTTRILSTVAPRADLSWAALEELPDEVALDVDKEARTTIQRVVLGALAYATAVDRAITERFPDAKKKKKQKDQPSIAHWTIGREIEINPELVRVAQSGAREIAFRIKSRFVVRGHYRNQAHGPNHSLRTTKWIAPFWKGPQEGARLVHTYKPTTTEAEDKS